MRLIDADEYAKGMKCRQNAVETAIEHPRTDVYYTDKEHWEGVLCTYAEAKLTLDNMPTVDAVPVKHGRWEPSDYNGFSRCSVCRDCYIDDTWTTTGKWQYCPNCGARMDGGEANADGT